MLGMEAKELIRDIVTLFAQATEIPIAVYEIDSDGKTMETIRADGQLVAPQKVDPTSCQAGLMNLSEPIIIDGKSVAVILYGTFGVTERDIDVTTKFKWVRETLPLIIQRVIYGYVGEKERLHSVQQGAYHDLQLRLQAALALAENILDELPRHSPAREPLENLTDAIEAASMVMHGLTQGQYLPKEYNFKRFPVRRFIDHAIRLCSAEADKKNIKFQVDLQPQNGNLAIQASEVHLQQAFNNLLHNAVKYSYRGTESSQRFVAVVGILLGGVYEVAISNYGVGIEPDELSHIFVDGYIGRLTVQEYRTGSGLGLSFAKRVIESHKGTISVHSQAMGEADYDSVRPFLTRFTVKLPLEQSQENKE